MKRLVGQQAATKEELDQRNAAVEVDRLHVKDAQETIRKTRAALGLPPDDANPTELPQNLDQTFSGVQVALSNVVQVLAQIGVSIPLYHLTPDKLIHDVAGSGQPSDSMKPSTATSRRLPPWSRRGRPATRPAKPARRRTEPVLHLRLRSHRRPSRKPHGKSRQQRLARPGADERPLADQHLDRGQFQGNGD